MLYKRLIDIWFWHEFKVMKSATVFDPVQTLSTNNSVFIMCKHMFYISMILENKIVFVTALSFRHNGITTHGYTVLYSISQEICGFCCAVLCCGYTLTDFPISIRLTSLALWQSNDCPSASKATLMNMDKYFMWIHYERLHNHNKAKHNKTVCIFRGTYCNDICVYAAVPLFE